MYKEHPDLLPPQNPDQVIWHYLSLSKFLGLLNKSALFFCRHDKYDDAFEGQISEKDKDYLESVHPGLSESMIGDNLGCFYSICWTKALYDEYVLWNSYSSLKDGVAIQTTINRLISSFDKDDERIIYVSDVQYIDYLKDYTFRKTGGKVVSFAPHFSKRRFYS